MNVKLYPYLGCLLMVLLAMPFVYHHGKNKVNADIKRDLAVNHSRLTRMFDVASALNESHANQLKTNLKLLGGQINSQVNLKDLKSVNATGQFGLDTHSVISGYTLEAKLAGIGSISELDNTLLKEIQAVLLLDLTSPFKQNSHDFLRAYYTSAKGFIWMAPLDIAKNFEFEHSLYEKPFWSVVTPTHNSNRKTVFSDVYKDVAGEVWVISLSSPIYQNAEFTGAISLDIEVSALNRLLMRSNSSIHPFLYLMNESNKVIACASCDMQNKLNLQTNSYGSHAKNDKPEELLVFTSDFIFEKFKIAFQIPQFTYFILVASHAAVPAGIVCLTAFIAALLIRLTRLLKNTAHHAKFDEVSKIYNRRTVFSYSRIEYEDTLSVGERLSVLLVDIDNFKIVNDTYGHLVGDDAIHTVAQVISKAVRHTDIFGRYGGEEFLITLPRTGINGAQRVAEKIRLAIKNTQFSNGLKVTVSIGCAEFDADKQNITLEHLVSDADKALYKAKAQGRDRTECAPVFENSNVVALKVSRDKQSGASHKINHESKSVHKD